MPRFSAATLLRLTAACAVYLGLSTSIGYGSAAALCLGAVALTWAIVSKLSGWRWAVRITVGLVASVAVWFSAVMAVWKLEICDRCWSERYTIDYQVIGVSLTSDEVIVPTWRSLTADALGVPCKNQFRFEPYRDDHRGPIGPPRDRGALTTILNSVYDPESPWWRQYDILRKWYFLDHLSTDDYSPELNSRLKQLSIDSPEVATQFWSRVESDYHYLWDGLLTDQLALCEAENGELLEASKWLEGSSPIEARFLARWNTKEWKPRVEKLKQLDIGEVLVYRINRGVYQDGDGWAHGSPVIRLPSDPARRSQALKKLSDLFQAEDADAAPLSDYGQRYVNAP